MKEEESNRAVGQANDDIECKVDENAKIVAIDCVQLSRTHTMAQEEDARSSCISHFEPREARSSGDRGRKATRTAIGSRSVKARECRTAKEILTATLRFILRAPAPATMP
jgi:uncharacterized protein YuzE